MKAAFKVLLMLACLCPLTTSAQSASGHSTEELFEEIDGQPVRIGKRHISFNAITHPDGSVTGQLEVRNSALRVRAHGEIACIFVDEDGDQAWILGVWTQYPLQEDYVGKPFLIGIEDNGQGRNADLDRVSRIATILDPVTVGILCALFEANLPFVFPLEGNVALPSIPVDWIDGGNVDIRP